jgi:hydrogenase maturation protein HypF
VRFEGQAAMELEFALEAVSTDEFYPIPFVATSPASTPSSGSLLPQPVILDWAQLLEAVLLDYRAGAPMTLVSARFHNALVEAIVAVARRAGVPSVALSGGCFQNRYLTEHVIRRLRQEGFRPYWHQRVPPNDGGIALGQAMAAHRP